VSIRFGEEKKFYSSWKSDHDFLFVHPVAQIVLRMSYLVHGIKPIFILTQICIVGSQGTFVVLYSGWRACPLLQVTWWWCCVTKCQEMHL